MNKTKKAKAHRPKKMAGQDATQRNDVPAVGHVLRRAREHRELGLREVERLIGRSSAYLSQVERGLIRQPDPSVLSELAELYKLDFLTLAKWAGWTDRLEESPEGRSSANLLVRRVLELNETQRAEVFNFIEKLLREQRT
ncbi:MAG: helix-turn-helix domain-containing protein [Terriglobales bacterium]